MKLLKVIFTLLFSLLVSTESVAQFSQSAVMTIRAEILPASQIDSNIQSDISDQIVEGREGASAQNVNIGEFTLRVPEEVEFSTHIDQHIEMSDGRSGWNMNSFISDGEKNNGAISYQINVSVPENLSKGLWQGEQVATIEYH